MAASRPGEMRIGEVLGDARRRAGIEVRDAEERTKIRAKYLHALEHEAWEVLPSAAYAKGFLRTYAQLLGLDAEAIVDEFRRQVESDRDSGVHPVGEQVLERSRRIGPGAGGPSPWLLAALALVTIAAVLLVIGVTGGDDGPGHGQRGGKGAAKEDKRKRRHERRSEAGSGTVKLGLRVVEPVEVCLLGGGGEALIDGQVLAAGSSEEYERRRLELRFPSGFAADQIELEIAGKRRLLPKARGPAAYRIIAPQRVRQLAPPGQECP